MSHKIQHKKPITHGFRHQLVNLFNFIRQTDFNFHKISKIFLKKYSFLNNKSDARFDYFLHLLLIYFLIN